MKRFFFIALIIYFASDFIKAQDFLPFATSNYAGVTGVALQPASIADSRYKFDLAISSTSYNVVNNFFGLDPYTIWHPKSVNVDNIDSYISKNYNGESKSGMMSLKQDLFSFMISLSAKDAIAFTPSVRAMVNFDNITENLLHQVDSSLKDPSYWKRQLENDNFSLQGNSWVQYGFTYARVITDKGKHFLKAGVTANLTQGVGSAYLFATDLTYNFTNSDTLSIFNSKIKYGTSDNYYDDLGKIKYKFNANPSLAFDFGLVYEFRPDWMKYKYDLDGQNNIWKRDEEKYLIKVGFTISDLGSVRYRRNPVSRDFDADTSNLPIGSWEIHSRADIDSIIGKYFHYNDVSSKYNMNNPAVVSMQLDVRVARGFYLNFLPYVALKQGNKDVNKVHYVSAMNFIPRYDSKLFGISLPIQYNEYKQWNIGLGFRIGMLWIGSNDLISVLASSKNRYGTAVSFALKIPVFYKAPNDLDGDHVSDDKDKCPDVPGLVELNGCPDADGDGVADLNDRCPNLPGTKELFGCPDKDGDGITDEKDLCPDVKGLVQFSGCPDSDGDGIIDQNDACPFNAGTVAMNGCPDQDEDGIADKDDNCPTVPGTREFHGCPYIDTDGDGIIDQNDKCPGVKGPMDNNGCPYQDTDNDSIPDKDDECPSIAGSRIFRGCPDTDGDGISDKYDICPTIAGVPQNNGCPEIKKEEQEILRKAFENLEFETGKAVIRSSSFSSLDELAIVMKKRAEFKLSLAGHTDNAGSPESNMTLSKNRVNAVKDYLVKNGVEPSHVKTEWFGQTKPIAPNTTPEGRQKNRRVEMNITFE